MACDDGNTAVVEWACRALYNITIPATNKEAFTAAGGIEAVVRVMGEHQAKAAVMQQTCRALCNIGWSDEALQKRIKDAGAEPLVRAAVAAPDATDKTKEQGQMLLGKLGIARTEPNANTDRNVSLPTSILDGSPTSDLVGRRVRVFGLHKKPE